MKKTTLSHLAMYQNVLAVVKNHQSTWAGIQGMAAAVDQLEDRINQLSSHLNLQKTLTSGIRAEKADYMNELIGQMVLLKKGLFLYAVETGDLALRDRNKESGSKLKGASENSLEVAIDGLLEDLETHGAALLSITGITALQIQSFRDQAALFEQRKNSVRQAIIERSVETNTIRGLEKQLNKLLIEQLDRFISFFQSANQSFFLSYKSARRIIGKSGGPGGSKNNLPAV